MVKKFYYEGLTNNKTLNDKNNKKIETLFIPDFEKECLFLLRQWEKQKS